MDSLLERQRRIVVVVEFLQPLQDFLHSLDVEQPLLQGRHRPIHLAQDVVGFVFHA